MQSNRINFKHTSEGQHTCDLICASMKCCVEQVVGRFLEGSQHEHTVLHFCNAKSCDSQHLTLHITAQITSTCLSQISHTRCQTLP